MLRYVLEPGAPQRPDSTSVKAAAAPDAEETFALLRDTTIGSDHEIQTPFGSRGLVYTDYTASGRGSTIVEDFMREKVLPCYGNTHTLTTATARQTTYLRAEARELIRHHLNASHEDAIIFAGSGSTGASHLFVQALQRASFDIVGGGSSASNGELRDMHYREDRWGSGECTLCGVRVKSATVYQAHKHSEAHRAKVRAVGGVGSPGRAQRRRVVVITDPTLHHSSSLPFRELLPKYPLASGAALGSFEGASWREACADGVEAASMGMELSNLPIDESTGLFSEGELRTRLEYLSSWGSSEPGLDVVVICVLAAASNVTGICADVPRTTASIRSACSSAVVCWDFAAAAGHRACDMNPPGCQASAVDAAFFSPHKLWGGPGSTGVLAVKKRLLCNAVPAVVGGGVVFYVTDRRHSYIQNSEEREEAGTPNILGCIRAGLAYHLLDQLPGAAVESRETKMLQRMLTAWSAHPRIEILGPTAKFASHDAGKGMQTRTGVVSFMLRYGNDSPGLYLHYNFVAALLNDLFGVQARGGCACAGPYAQWLLGVGPELSKEFEECLQRTAQEVLRPGFVRVGAHWALTDEELEILISAVLWVADHGWKLLAAYTFDRETGEWLHRLDTPERRRVWLSGVRPGNHLQTASVGPISQLESTLQIGEYAQRAPRTAKELTLAAESALKDAYSSAQVALSSSKCPVLDPGFAHLLWFALPTDVAYTLRSAQPDSPQLVKGSGVFMAAAGGDSLRPAHSSMDARQAQGQPSQDHGSHAGGDMEAASLEDMFEFAGAEGDDDGDCAFVRNTDGGAPNYPKCMIKPKMTKQIRGLVGRAIADFNMVQDGDRLLVGLSGGKDSLTVLHVLLALQKSAPIKFHIAAATVDPQTPEYNPAPLVPYLAAMGVEYHMLSKPIIELAKTCIDPKRPSICAFCSRMKRGMLYSCMREKNYNVLVLGQHLDDFAESFFMSGIHNGLLRTMKANYWVQQEDVRVCRPLLYVRESMTADFAKENKLPVISDNCPACFSAPKERHKTKLLLASLEFDYPQLFPTLLRTMKPLYSVDSAEKGDWIASGDPEDDGALPAEPPTKRKQQQHRGRNGIETAAAAASSAEQDFGAEYALTACGASEGVVCCVGEAASADGEIAASGRSKLFLPGEWAQRFTHAHVFALGVFAGALGATGCAWLGLRSTR